MSRAKLHAPTTESNQYSSSISLPNSPLHFWAPKEKVSKSSTTIPCCWISSFSLESRAARHLLPRSRPSSSTAPQICPTVPSTMAPNSERHRDFLAVVGHAPVSASSKKALKSGLLILLNPLLPFSGEAEHRHALPLPPASGCSACCLCCYSKRQQVISYFSSVHQCSSTFKKSKKNSEKCQITFIRILRNRSTYLHNMHT